MKEEKARFLQKCQEEFCPDIPLPSIQVSTNLFLKPLREISFSQRFSLSDIRLSEITLLDL